MANPPLLGMNPMMASRTIGNDDSLFAGWMWKNAPQSTDSDKVASIGRKLRIAANSMRRQFTRHGDYRRRFFVLDGHDLRYFRDESVTEYAGRIDLATVLRVQPAEGEDRPPHAIDLVRYVQNNDISLCGPLWVGQPSDSRALGAANEEAATP